MNLIDVCDEKNNLTGRKEQIGVIHSKGLWHRVSHVWLYTSKGEVVLQLRSRKKRLFPGLLDVSAAGHIDSGETPRQAALRETKEELGITLKKINFWKIIKNSIIFDKIINNEFYYVFFSKIPRNTKFSINHEVESVHFVNIAELLKSLNKSPQKYVPHGRYWINVLNEIKRRSQVTG
ncbi:NUDIX domain-containing protein [Candidatus Pacearchaeota archaeon]|nr:MAG: NUDIX domain-containing protein [Candidatus Pacearchaeota archaeon]